jgi:hypothetical protein
MIRFRRLRQHGLRLLCGLGAMVSVGKASEVLPAAQPVITSLAIVGTNLEFSATFPADVDRAVLELRPTLTTNWQIAAQLEAPAAGGEMAFSFPQPALEMAFFRLNITLRANLQAEQSSEVRYVTMPSLAKSAPRASLPAEAVFHFKGQIDGSDRIVITHQGALWEHFYWGWPADSVTVNGSQWQPWEKNFMTTTGAVAFLPAEYSLASARLEVIEGRDVIALERTNNALWVWLDDTPPGSAPYEFKIHFYPAPKAPAEIRSSPVATLKIAARVDGSDQLKITAGEATLVHKAWGLPEAVKLNDVNWDVGRTNRLVNAGTNTFLPPGIDFSTAKIVQRKGRDLATLWAEAEALWVTFADNPNGADDYELQISFGP